MEEAEMNGVSLSDSIFKKYGFELIRVENDGTGFEYYINGPYRLDTVFTFDGISNNYRYSLMLQDQNYPIGFNRIFLGYINSESELETILKQTGVLI